MVRLICFNFQSKTRGLPDDHSGPIRVIEIEGIDSNMCCGTHVSSLGQLQMIKLLHVEKQKKYFEIILSFLNLNFYCVSFGTGKIQQSSSFWWATGSFATFL